MTRIVFSCAPYDTVNSVAAGKFWNNCECNNRKRMFLEDKNLCDFQKGGVVIYNISLNFAS